jgi:hypothetical protein
MVVRASCQYHFDRPTRRERKRCPIAKAHDDVPATPRHADERRQFWPHWRDFNRLIDEGVFEAKRGRFQRYALTGASGERSSSATEKNCPSIDHRPPSFQL